MTTREVLVKARELIASPERWTKGSYAVDAGGYGVDPTDLEACAWCLDGALYRVTTGADASFRSHEYLAARDAVAAVPEVDGVPIDFNERHTHAQVLAAFDKAIAGCGCG